MGESKITIPLDDALMVARRDGEHEGFMYGFGIGALVAFGISLLCWFIASSVASDAVRSATQAVK